MKPMRYLIYPLVIFCITIQSIFGFNVLIPMDEFQSNHLKAYGFAYQTLKNSSEKIEWLINYRGGSFLFQNATISTQNLTIKGIKYELISNHEVASIIQMINSPSSNMEIALLNKFAKIALYSPKSASPWDDAVSLALEYAEIPFEIIYDQDILNGRLNEFDWIHLHHEDFTGQMGKMFTQKDQNWYQVQLNEDRNTASKNGFSKVSMLKNKISITLKEFVIGGGYLFAMCNATDTFDIALATSQTDICEVIYDGDPIDSNYETKLDFKNTIAFENFKLFTNPRINEFSTIDSSPNYQSRSVLEDNDFFELIEFSAKSDLIPCMLTQNHTNILHGFMGQTTAFSISKLKSTMVILGQNEKLEEAKYIYSSLGKGFFSFLGGHDPEDYQHFVNEEHTDLNLHKNSPGYRLILNNVLFPSAQKKKQKT